MHYDFLPDYTETKRCVSNFRDVLIIVPVYNEMPHLEEVIISIKDCWQGDILAVDDCSTDNSLEALNCIDDISVISNHSNAGAGGVLLQGFQWAYTNNYQNIITMDADGQHSPEMISAFLHAIEKCGCCKNCNFIWGSRYLVDTPELEASYAPRREINIEITQRLNDVTGFNLTDAFCGFRAYRLESLAKLPLTEVGYGMFMQMTILAAKHKLSIREIEVPLVYLDETRDFNGNFSDTSERLEYYHKVIDKELDS